MSRKNLDDLRAEVGGASRTYQSAVDALDEVAADYLGINRTDLRCLDVLMQQDGVAPSQLGKELGLTSGSVTAMLHRLEALAYVSRLPDPADGRKAIVRITAGAARKAWEIYGPLAEEGSRNLGGYTAPQLELVIDFLSRGERLYEAHIARVRDMLRKQAEKG